MKVAPSILTANFTNLAQEIKSVEKGSDYIHVDIMDGHFVPNISFGPAIAGQISEVTDVLLDIHLMVDYPLLWIDKVNFKTTEFITVHAESNRYAESIKRIKYLGKKAGLCIKPSTPVDIIMPYLNQLDLVLVMGVEPGYGGQMFIQSQLDKIKMLADLKKEHGYTYEIEVDGGINATTAKQCAEAGATIVVAGTYIFNFENREERINTLK
ncbi:ribulose-phosphate 3-epimerase [Acholeplasma hippikon]|uniref:Ribulose-phosphate 3-epimerase n=1 Tax=Acholeplasma hippikon TaxID=264636 RepID=A0A449BK34_9MOLU|nr:ribulose-phosphate 3-epimerase [Acholeplasma hippikon]VEU82835.1 d-ribulose-5-phosphate 3 epimerase [Acholeplasma hippikon]